MVQSFAPYIAALALSYILFDGGIGLTISNVLNCSPRAILLAVLGFTFSIIATGLFIIIVFKVSLLYGLLFGSIFGGSSAIIIISLVTKIKISEKVSTTLILESMITDIFCIITSIAIIGIIVTGRTDYAFVIAEIGGKFVIGALIGIFVGIMWLLIMRRIKYLSFSYILTLAVVLFAYVTSEILGGNGALSALLLGWF